MDGVGAKDQRYRHDEDLETLTVTLSSGDDIIMWSYAIDVRACNDLPKRGFNEKDDYVVFHYTDKEGFGKITSSRTVWASMSPQIDSNFGFGVYSSCKAPHQWRSKKEIFINNFFPSKKDWEQRKHLDFEEWPSLEALKFNKPGLSDRELNELLNTPFGNAVLKKWEPTRKCDFCVPIVYAARDKTILEAAKEHDLPAVRGFLREDPAAAHLCLWHANGPAAQWRGRAQLGSATVHRGTEVARHCILLHSVAMSMFVKSSWPPLLIPTPRIMPVGASVCVKLEEQLSPALC
eukprot:Skav225936  [mRNA]  locus=scaffold1500:401820:407903:- [translate_table: standard]